MKLVGNIVNRAGEIRPKRDSGVITWGRKIPIGDCEAQESTIGKLHFRATDYVDTIRLYEKSRVVLGNVEDKEKNQCVILHVVDGAQWIREGRKNGVPTPTRVLADAEEWGEGGIRTS